MEDYLRSFKIQTNCRQTDFSVFAFFEIPFLLEKQFCVRNGTLDKSCPKNEESEKKKKTLPIFSL